MLYILLKFDGRFGRKLRQRVRPKRRLIFKGLHGVKSLDLMMFELFIEGYQKKTREVTLCSLV
jgi:hypothetical protein